MLYIISLSLFFVFNQIIANVPDISTINAAVYGPISNIKNLNPSVLLYNLKFLQESRVPRERQLEIFRRIKGKRRFDNMTIEELDQIGNFIQGVPTYILHEELDCKNDDIVGFLGRAKLRKRLLGVLAECLKKEFGPQVYLNYKYINKYGSVICGYGVEELSQIDDNNFFLIQENVLVHLDECSIHQLQVLYDIAVKPTVYGIPQGWDKRVVRTLGTLLTLVPLDELNTMDYRSFSEVNGNVLKKMSLEKLKVIKAHLRSFNLRSKNVVWRILGIPSMSKFWKNDEFLMFHSLVFLLLVL